MLLKCYWQQCGGRKVSALLCFDVPTRLWKRVDGKIMAVIFVRLNLTGHWHIGEKC